MLNQAYNNGQVRAMKEVFRDTPSDLEDLYPELLSKERGSNEIKESVLVFQWVLFARHRLSTEELYFAVLAGTNPDLLAAWDRQKESHEIIQRYITSTSKGLIEVINECRGQILQFIH
jgi:hypothetical protein